MEFPPVDEIAVTHNGNVFINYFYPLTQVPPKEACSLIDFYHIWRNSNSELTIPLRKDLSFEKLGGWHANIRLVDLENSTPEADKIIISGNIFNNYFGKETMGTEIRSSTTLDPEIIKGYNKFLKYFHSNHYGLVFGATPNLDSRLHEVIWIDLPLSNDGTTITHMLTALIPL